MFRPYYLMYGYDEFLDLIADGKNRREKLGLIKYSYGLEKLAEDPDKVVSDAAKKALQDNQIILTPNGRTLHITTIQVP